MKISRRPKKISLRTRLIKKIDQVAPEEWNKIFPHVPERYHFLKTLDESGFDQFSFSYVLVYDKKQLVGCAPCFIVDYSLDTSIMGPLRRVTNAIKKVFPRIFSLKVVVCGIPMGQGQMGTPKDNPAILAAIEQRMENLARKIRAPLIAFKDFDKSYDRLFASLLPQGYLKIDSLPQTCLKLDAGSFEDYLKMLGSSSRYDFRRKLKKSADIKIESSILTNLDEKSLDEVYDLYLQAVEIHDIGFEIVPKAFFRLISQNMPRETRFFLWRIDGKLAAYGFCLVTRDVLLDYYLGFDPNYAHIYHMYFIRMKGIIEYCIQHGIKTYEMGTTGYEPKRRLKFDFVPVYIYVKMRPVLLRPALKLLRALLKFENFDPVLKEWKRNENRTTSA